jgi:hypothetical protein
LLFEQKQKKIALEDFFYLPTLSTLSGSETADRVGTEYGSLTEPPEFFITLQKEI